MKALIFLRRLYIYSAVNIYVKLALNINGKLWLENINFAISADFMVEDFMIPLNIKIL